MFTGKRIKQIRLERGLTLRELARIANISSFSYIHNVESGVVKDPALSTIIKLADAFEMSLDELVGREYKNE